MRRHIIYMPEYLMFRVINNVPIPFFRYSKRHKANTTRIKINMKNKNYIPYWFFLIDPQCEKEDKPNHQKMNLELVVEDTRRFGPVIFLSLISDKEDQVKKPNRYGNLNL